MWQLLSTLVLFCKLIIVFVYKHKCFCLCYGGRRREGSGADSRLFQVKGVLSSELCGHTSPRRGFDYSPSFPSSRPHNAFKGPLNVTLTPQSICTQTQNQRTAIQKSCIHLIWNRKTPAPLWKALMKKNKIEDFVVNSVPHPPTLKV